MRLDLNNRISFHTPAMIMTFEGWRRVFPIRRIETPEKITEAIGVLSRLIDSGSLEHQGARDYYNTLVILVAEAEDYQKRIGDDWCPNQN